MGLVTSTQIDSHRQPFSQPGQELGNLHLLIASPIKGKWINICLLRRHEVAALLKELEKRHSMYSSGRTYIWRVYVVVVVG